MHIPKATLSSKNQITIPMEVYRKMNLSPKSQLLFLELRPGEFQIVPAPKKRNKEDWAKNLHGKYQDDSIDGVQSLIDDRKEDLILEERGYLN